MIIIYLKKLLVLNQNSSRKMYGNTLTILNLIKFFELLQRVTNIFYKEKKEKKKFMIIEN